MTIEQSTLLEKVNRARADIARELPGSNTFDAGFLNATAVAIGGMSDEISTEISQLLSQLFPLTATNEFLEQWASIRAISRNGATSSAGSIVVTGVASTIVPISTNWQSLDNITYISSSDVTIENEVFAITSITRIGQTATVTTATVHTYATGQTVNIAGAVETQYNGSFVIIVNNSTEFQYTILGTPSTPATGTLLSDSDMAIIPVNSQQLGSLTNAIMGQAVVISAAIGGVDGTAFVSQDNIQGGNDTETDDKLRIRFLNALANSPTGFSEKDVINAVRLVPEASRVLVKRATPAAGQVTVLFMTDDSLTITPSAEQIAQAKSNIQDIADVTVDDINADIIVTVPTLVNTNFVFSTIEPNTSTMKTAIINNLSAFFSDGVDIEKSVTEKEYESAIFNTIDPDTGESLDSFILSSPVGDITITNAEVAALGTVAFDV